ncbi:unnamed protein product [Rhizophagus irregularis]|nr:unnamed protein product [Rhizophagus irregularis]
MCCLEPSLTTMSCKRRELTIFERGEVIGAWKCGVSERKIAEALNCPSCTIHKVISTYKIRDRKMTLQELHENFVDSTSTHN